MKVNFLFLILFVAGCFGCSDDLGDEPVVPNDRQDIVLDGVQQSINTQVKSFAFDLVREYAGSRSDKDNYVISPLGLSYLLGLTLNGAGGETYDEMQDMLGFRDYSMSEINQYVQTLASSLSAVDNTVSLFSANCVWTKKNLSLLSEFKRNCQTYYDAQINENQLSDKASSNAINAWCKEKTEGYISEFVEAADLQNIAILIMNALYFKGQWTVPFEVSSTDKAPFISTDGSVSEVNMMHKESGVACNQTDEVILISLPYGNEAFSMQFFMPTDPEGDLDDLLQGLTAEKWGRWIATKPQAVKLSIPRFEIISEEKDYIHVLKGLGMESAFATEADFSKMSSHSLPISQIKQSVRIQVDESGAIASSVSDSEFLDYYVSDLNTPGLISIAFDRPFGFAITEISTGTVLFMGKISTANVLK